MLNGFEEITAPMNKEELMLVPRFLEGFKTKIGKELAITKLKNKIK